MLKSDIINLDNKNNEVEVYQINFTSYKLACIAIGYLLDLNYTKEELIDSIETMNSGDWVFINLPRPIKGYQLDNIMIKINHSLELRK